MTRVRMLVTTAIPALLVGALVGHAAPGSNDGYWSTSGGVIVADNDPPKRKRIPPGPPVGDIWSDSADTPPTPPSPPDPPHPPRAPRSGGVSVSINGNNIEISGIDELVNEHLESVTKMLKNNPKIPKVVRDKIAARMDKVRGIVDKRLKNVKKSDLDKLEAEMEKLEGELEGAMQGLDEDLKDLGKQLGKDFAKQIKGKISVGDDSDDDDDNNADPEPDADPDPVVITDLGDITLKPAQRDALRKLRTQSEARVAAETQLLEKASEKLEAALTDPKTSSADVEKLVDQVSGHEAAIRKARLVAWVEARRLLDADQVKKLEAAHQHP